MSLLVLGLPKTTGLLFKPTDANNSTTPYASTGLAISEVYIQDKTGVLQGIRLGTEHTVWIAYTAVSERIKRSDLILIDTLQVPTALEIDSMLFQTDNEILITLDSAGGLTQLLVGDSVSISGSTNPSNDGVFTIVEVTASTVKITNFGRSDNTDDESGSSAIIDIGYRRFEVNDIEDKVLSEFVDHYQINLINKND